MVTLRSVPTLAVAYGMAAAATFVLNICVGRANGAAALGDFALAVATARIFFAATDMGLTTHMTRQVSRDTSRAQSTLAMFLTVRLSLIPIAVIMTSAAGVVFGRENVAVFAFVAAAQGFVSVQALYESLVLAHDRQMSVALLTAASALCISGAALCWYLFSRNADVFAASYAGASGLAVVVWLRWSTKFLGVRPRFVPPSRGLLTEIFQSWPIGVSMLLGIASLRMPLLVLGAFSSPEEVGAFSAVDMVITASAIAQAAISSATFPRLAATFAADPERFRRLFCTSNAALGVFGALVAIFLAFAGAPLLKVLFPTKDFVHVSVVMPIAAWSVPALLLVHHNIFIFAAANRETLNLRFMAVWFVLISMLQLGAVPTHGLEGSAWALLIARCLGLIVLACTVYAARIPSGYRR